MSVNHLFGQSLIALRSNLVAVKLMTTLIRLMEKPKSTRSMINATQREQQNDFIQQTHLISRQRRRMSFDGSTIELAHELLSHSGNLTLSTSAKKIA